MSRVVDVLIAWLGSLGYAGIFTLLLLCGLGLPMPEEPILITAGYMAFRGYIELWPAIVVSMAGILLGDTLAFFIGKRFGLDPRLLRFFKRFSSPRNLVRARRFMRTHGNRTVFIVRFLPGLRMPTYFMAGALGVRFAVFFAYDLLAALISVPVSVMAAWYFGDEIHDALQFTGEFHRYLIGGIVLLVILWIVHSMEKRYIRRQTKLVPEQDREPK